MIDPEYLKLNETWSPILSYLYVQTIKIKCDEYDERGLYKVLKETRVVGEYPVTRIAKFQRSGGIWSEAGR